MNFIPCGELTNFDKIIQNGVDFGGFALPQNKPKKVIKNFYSKIVESIELDREIFDNIKSEKEIIVNNVEGTVTVDNKHNESFLFRLFYSYESYIMKYSEDETEMYSFNGENKLKKVREYDVEREIISNYARDITTYKETPFPNNKIEFLYDFFIFLSAHLTDLIKIKQIEFESRYNKFYGLVIEFKRYVETHKTFETIQKEFDEFGHSPFQLNVVEYICKNVGLF